MGTASSAEINEVENKIESLIIKTKSLELKCNELVKENSTLKTKIDELEDQETIRAARFASIKKKLMCSRREQMEEDSEEESEIERITMSF